MRKIACSSNVASRIRLRSCAEARSRPKGFSMMTRASVGAARLGQLFHDQPEQHGRDGEVVRRPLRRAELLAEGLKRGRVVVVAVHIAQQAAQLVERRGVESAVVLEAVARPGPELVEVPAGLGHADDRHVEVAAFHHRLQRREDFLVGQIARGAEEDQGVGMGMSHRHVLSSAVTCWPISPGVRRTRNAWPTAACPRNPPRRAS